MKDEAARKLEAIWNHTGDALVLAEVESRRILDANPQAELLLGRSVAELRGMVVSALHPPDQEQEVVAGFDRSALGPGRFINLEILRPDGMRVPVEICTGTFHDDRGRLIGIGSFRDRSARVDAEREIRRLNWALSAVNRANLAVANAETESAMMSRLCEGITGDAFVLAWIGLAGPAPEKRVAVAAASGAALGYLEGLSVSWADEPMGRGPTGLAIRFNRTQVNNDALGNPAFSPWAARAMGYGMRASMATPLMRDGQAFGALTIYSSQAHAFGDEEVRVFEDLARELVLGLDSRRHRAAYEAEVSTNQAHTARHRAALEQMVATLAATIEMRDPYTAGHQKRVADLAKRIARALGMNEEHCQAIYLAGLVHDIGKINVPSEILNKPGRLLDIELALVKIHAVAGYDILRGVEFPWPLAAIARQHHERLDGSGYPDGLKGGAILREAQVIAVADIFEAMSSHRPYRPALGPARAIRELLAMRGSQLDAEVVDAGIAVFERLEAEAARAGG